MHREFDSARTGLLRGTSANMDSLELLRELRRTGELLKAFNDVGRSLTSTLDPRQVVEILHQKLGETFRPEAWALLLFEGERQALEVHLAVGEGAAQLLGVRAEPGEGISGWVAQTGQAVLLDDVRSDPRFSARIDPVPDGVRSFMAVPLRTLAVSIGVVALTAREGRPYRPEDLRILEAFADYAAIAISNARNFEKVRELTLVDDHTALFNSRHLYRTLDAETARARRYRRPLSVIFFDLDFFKRVNDTHGHQAGSELLREIGEIMRRTLRTMDVPVRYGGDEFVVILPETTREQAQVVAERLRSDFRATRFLAMLDRPVEITASFGIASWPDDGDSPEELLKAADAAMYRAKGAGRDAVAT
jgi:diguanylate cyclase (GGDEF)-like protein